MLRACHTASAHLDCCHPAVPTGQTSLVLRLRLPLERFVTPNGQMLIDILAALEADGCRMHDRAKAGRIKDLCQRVRAADGGRANAGWVKAQDTTPARYFRTPHSGPPQAPPGTYGGEDDGKNADDSASECATEYGSDGLPNSDSDPRSDSSGEADYHIHQAQTEPNPSFQILKPC